MFMEAGGMEKPQKQYIYNTLIPFPPVISHDSQKSHHIFWPAPFSTQQFPVKNYWDPFEYDKLKLLCHREKVQSNPK